MKPVLTIKVKDFYKDSIHYRESATELFDLIRSEAPESAELDFKDIAFISRSFADQLHKEKMQLLNQHIVICLTNTSDEIIKMLNVVSKTQNAPVTSTSTFRVNHFNDFNSLGDYLLSF